jgi:hypothetical protein
VEGDEDESEGVALELGVRTPTLPWCHVSYSAVLATAV